MGTVGCGDSYPESLEYPVRDDPIYVSVDPINEAIGKENKGNWPIGPDPLGVLPIMTFADLDHERLIKYQHTGISPEAHESGADAKQWQPTEWLNEGHIIDPARVVRKYRLFLKRRLKEYYGTPAKPTVNLTTIEGANVEAVANRLKLDDQTLAMGSRLYRIHCLHCHGVSGDGRGPTARWVNPHPRDYRSGLFKFISTYAEEPTKPRRDDLLRTLREGVEGTSMPSFRLLKSDELEALASYVIHLSMRGEVELILLKSFDYNPQSKRYDKYSAPISLPKFLANQVKDVTNRWLDDTHNIEIKFHPVADALTAYSKSNDPKELQGSITRGFEIFKESCLGCHIDYGRKAFYKMDAWGTFTKPADLTTGIFRGGRRPADLYYRIHAGIYPSLMIPLAKHRHEQGAWDIINFVRVLPHRKMLKNLVPKVHAEIY